MRASSSASSASKTSLLPADAALAWRRHPLLIAYAVALAPAILMAFAQPVWSRVDEAHHADFVIQLSHGVYPVANRTLIDPETLALMESTGVYRAFYPSGSYPAPDLTDVAPPPPGMSDRADAVWMTRHLWQLSQESIQPPLYYAAMVPVWVVADHAGGPLAAVYTLRVVNALIAATLAPMAFALALMLAPARRDVAAAAAAIAAFVPGFALNGTRISNDTLAAAAGGLLLLLAVRWAGSGWTWRRALLAGVLLGAGLLVKVTLVALVPALLLSAMWSGRGAARRAGGARALAASAIGVAFLLPWFALNERFYGALMPNASLRLSDSLPAAFTPALGVLNLSVLGLTFWTGEPWGTLPLAAPFAVLATLLVLLAAVGAVRAFRSNAGVVRGPLAVAIVTALGMFGLSLLLPALASFEFVAPGRYAYPALPAVAALIAVGVAIVVASSAARRATTGLYSGIAVLMLVASALGIGAPQTPPAQGAPPSQARTFGVATTFTVEGLSVTLDRVALDSQDGATWFHVTVANTTQAEMEWPATATAQVGDFSGDGDYARSTHMPGDLEPGESVTGWLYVHLDPAKVHAGDTLVVRIAGVAPIDYSTIDDIDFAVRVPA